MYMYVMCYVCISLLCDVGNSYGVSETNLRRGDNKSGTIQNWNILILKLKQIYFNETEGLVWKC